MSYITDVNPSEDVDPGAESREVQTSQLVAESREVNLQTSAYNQWDIQEQTNFSAIACFKHR